MSKSMNIVPWPEHVTKFCKDVSVGIDYGSTYNKWSLLWHDDQGRFVLKLPGFYGRESRLKPCVYQPVQMWFVDLSLADGQTGYNKQIKCCVKRVHGRYNLDQFIVEGNTMSDEKKNVQLPETNTEKLNAFCDAVAENYLAKEDLSEYSVEELEKALERRKQKDFFNSRPEAINSLLRDPSLALLKNELEYLMGRIVKYGNADMDFFRAEIFDRCVVAFYGEEGLKWIHEHNRDMP